MRTWRRARRRAGRATTSRSGTASTGTLKLGDGSGFTNAGTIRLEPPTAGPDTLDALGGPFTNSGTIVATGGQATVVRAGSFTNTGLVDGYRAVSIAAPTIDNQGTMELRASSTLGYDGGTDLVNSGTINLAAGTWSTTYLTATGTFLQQAGTVTLDGTLGLVNGTFRQTGGTMSGYPIHLNRTDLAIGPATTARSFIYDSIDGDTRVLDDVPAGFHITLRNSFHGTLKLGDGSGFTNAGTIRLEPPTAGPDTLDALGGPFTNSGTIVATGGQATVVRAGSFTNTGLVDGYRAVSIAAPTIDNQGTMELRASSTLGYDGGTDLVNSGTINLAAGTWSTTYLTATGTFLQQAGTVTLDGTLGLVNGTFRQTGGTMSGYPIHLNRTDLAIGPATTARSFIYDSIDGDTRVLDDVPAGFHITLRNSFHGTLKLGDGSGFTNAGTIRLEPPTAGPDTLDALGGPFTNSGTIVATGGQATVVRAGSFTDTGLVDGYRAVRSPPPPSITRARWSCGPAAPSATTAGPTSSTAGPSISRPGPGPRPTSPPPARSSSRPAR